MALKLSVGLVALTLSICMMHVDGVSAGMATGYYDCCMASASWSGKAEVFAPVDVCKADGVTLIDHKTADAGQSGCNGGDQYMCSCMQPFDDSTDPSLAYGFAAFTSGNEAASDCACYLAEFAHDAEGKAMKRNKLLFQVVNTGGDVQSENFDVQIPGGGLGAFTQGCPKQWGLPAEEWGETYGGVKSASQCEKLPEALQAGCQWRFTSWADNPVLKHSPKRVKCPKALIDRSGCQRKDEASVQAYQGTTDEGGKAAESGYKRDRSVCSATGLKQAYAPSPAPDTGSDSATQADSPAQPTVPKRHKQKMRKVCHKWH